MCKEYIQKKFEQLFPAEAKKYPLKPFQCEVINNVIANGNTLCIMPTGGGKSLIYYLSGLLCGGVTIVVSPLIALIGDQELKLRELGYNTLSLHSGVSSEKQLELLKKFAQREINPRFIFVSPEKLATDGFFEYCIRYRKDDIKLVTIDEVHCVSQWGLQFRPFYKDIPIFLTKVFGNCIPKVLALTATLNPKELTDIIDSFHIGRKNILRDRSFMRSEITLKIIKCVDENQKEEKLWELLKIHKNEKILVYVYRVHGKRCVEDISHKANIEHGAKSAYFHGEMSAKKRQEVIEKFKRDDVNIVFATNAFGMGIDIKDIRVVIHFMLPESLEQYYQEVGRAARDKKAANAYFLYSEKNIDIKRNFFIDKSFPSRQMLEDVFSRIFKPQKGLQTLDYFDDEDTAKCLQYYITVGLVRIVAKGFGHIKELTCISNAELKQVFDSTKTKLLITSMKKSGKRIDEIINLVYSAIVRNEASIVKLDKSLVVDVIESELSNNDLDLIEYDIEIKKKYKYDLLDYFIYVINNSENSIELHQEIGRYLGADKESLERIYPTEKGDLVRSKSEVIIANQLFYSGLEYEYEKELKHSNGSMRPDFTVKTPSGNIYYWEHLGMLGTDEYDKTWLYKKEIYDNQFRGKLKITYEGITINNSVMQLINDLKEL